LYTRWATIGSPESRQFTEIRVVPKRKFGVELISRRPAGTKGLQEDHTHIYEVDNE
jgi:hypothetical protein